MICFWKGEFVEQKEAMAVVTDNGFLFGDGVYETLRTWEGEFVKAELHMQRLWNSMGALNLEIPYSADEVLGFVKEGVKRNDFESDTRVRITVTRGSHGFRFSQCPDASLLIQFFPMPARDERMYVEGAKAITFEAERAMPHVKSISFGEVILARGSMEKVEADEVFLVNKKGFVTEGSVSNLFLVKNGVLVTPDADILGGVMRTRILEAGEGFVELELREVKKDELYDADEVFFSNSVKGVVPVVEVDGMMVGEGKVGEVVSELQKRLG